MGGLATVLAQGVRFFIKLTAQIAIARLLVPADYGLIAMVAPVIGLVQLVGDLGLGQAALQRPDIKASEISALFWLGLSVNVVMSVLVILMAPLLAYLYHEPRLILISIAFAGLIPLSGLSVQPAALLSRNLRFGVLALLDIAPPAVGLIFGLTSAWIGLGYWSLVISATSESLMFVALVWLGSTWRPRFSAFWRSVGPFAQIGARITAFNLAQFVTATFDNMLIAITQGSAALGLYDKSYQTVTQPVRMLLMPADRVAIPLLVRLLPEPDRYRRAYLNMIRLIMLAGAPGITCVLVMSKELALALMGPHWNGIGPIVSWLCVGSLASLIYSSTTWLFVSQGRTGQQLRYGLITAAVSIVSFAAGLPWGTSGVAAGAGLSFFFICVPLTCWGATRIGPVKSIDVMWAVLPMISATIATALLLSAVADIMSRGEITTLAFSFFFSYGMFCLILYCIPSGRRLLKESWLLLKIFAAAN